MATTRCWAALDLPPLSIPYSHYLTRSLSRLLDRLVEQQFIDRVADPSDRRSQLIVLTHEGLTRRDLARQLYERSLEERLSGLSDSEREQLTALLDKLHQQLQAHLRTT